MSASPSYGARPWTFYVLATLFTLFVIFLYGPMISVLVLSFQGPSGSLVFPLREPSLMWFQELFSPRRTGDVAGAFGRSLPLALLVMLMTVLISVTAGFAFRRRFRGSTVIFYMAIASLIVPGLVLSIGTLVTFRYLGLSASWITSGLGAHLSWALPFGLLIMFAVLGRLNPAYEEAAYDLGASRWRTVKDVVVPIVFPGMIAVALFGFTLSYDEFPRSWLTVGTKNTLPLEIWTMTTNVTSPALYALGTVTTIVSFLVIALALSAILLIQRRRSTGK
ncbi:ABC transporter permease [Prosthecomicrobium pneumaticum]|uniref:Putative spermidine/putrescine transport system permease protein n=1 Tax=Prosthecomicrobium pneumaticum TaxID=81895 RepID=A0A7W9CUJ6_9HYPH|nr:ABC transporter permease [Prosthecomicrobium pneumaticum]MBB5751914.1 putative spermidine/putrescine transport system permease protein [Prosthecomicrobium pneumaticum]